MHTQGLLQTCGDIKSDPSVFNMSLAYPELPEPTFTAGAEVDLTLEGFFHQGVNRVASKPPLPRPVAGCRPQPAPRPGARRCPPVRARGRVGGWGTPPPVPCPCPGC